MRERAFVLAMIFAACTGGQPEDSALPATEEPTTDFIQEAVWSPGGDRLMVSWNRGPGFRLYDLSARADAPSSRPWTVTPLTDGDGVWASWSSDGRWIAYQAGDDVYRVRSDGTEPERLTDDPGYDGEPAFSPDGSTIVFVSDREVGERGIYLMDADGSDVRRVDTGVAGDHFGPEWSPDGFRIVFYATTTAGDSVYVTRPAGGSSAVATGVFPSWSPDGRELYYGSNDTIWVQGVDAGARRSIVTGGFAPRPSPDGARLVFVRGRWPSSALWLKNLETGEETRLTP